MTVVLDSNVSLRFDVGFGNAPLSTGMTWTDISRLVRKNLSIEIERGRDSLTDRFSPGKATVHLDNSTGAFDPNSTRGAYDPNVKLLTRFRISAIHSATTYQLFDGFVTAWPQKSEQGQLSYVPMRAADGLKVLNLTETASTFPQEASGTRIGKLLDEAGWPSDLRSIDTGTKTLMATTTLCESVLAECRRVEDTEAGFFYMQADGTATFRDTHTRIQDHSTAVATWGDKSTELSYTRLTRPYDDAQIWNRAKVTRQGGSAQTYTSTQSRDDFGTRGLAKADLLMLTDVVALNLAQYIVDQNSTAAERVTFQVKPRGTTAAWPRVLGDDISTRYTVKRRPGDGSTWTQDGYVERIRHTISEREWTTSYLLSPVIHDDWWILGVSELGTDTRLGY